MRENGRILEELGIFAFFTYIDTKENVEFGSTVYVVLQN